MTDKFENCLLNAISNTEQILNYWEPAIEASLSQGVQFANGDLIKFLLAQIQEFLYTMQKVTKLISPMSNVNPRNSDALPPPVKMPKMDQDGNKIKPAPATERFVQDSATFEQAGFKSALEMELFKRGFLNDYIIFTLGMISKILPLIAQTDITSDLPIMQLRLKQFSTTVASRVAKATFTLLKLYPGAQTHRKQSVFDQDFRLFQLLNAENPEYATTLSEIQTMGSYEVETNKLLTNEGLGANSVKYITQQSKIIKDQISDRIEQVLADQMIKPTLFCSNKVIESIFATCGDSYSISQVMFRQAFEHQYGSQMLTGSSWESFLTFFNTNSSNFDLVDLVNVTDFLPISKMLTVFEQDSLNLCLDAVRKENARNYTLEKRLVAINHLKESVMGEHLSSKISVKQLGSRTLFIRTNESVRGKFDLVFAMYLLGLKNFHLNTQQMISQVKVKMLRHPTTENVQADPRDALRSQGQTQLLIINQNALDLTHQLAVGQHETAVPVLLTPGCQIPLKNYSSQARTSQKVIKQAYKKQNDDKGGEASNEVVTPLNPKQDEINRLLYDLTDYEITDKGFFVTFESEKEVIYMLSSASLQQTIFKMVGDKGLRRGNSPNQTVPYFVSALLVDQYTSNQLLNKIFSLDENLNLFQLKDLIRFSYKIACFAETEQRLARQVIELKTMITHKYYKFFLKLVAISIDGFKSDRYHRKINDIAVTIEGCQNKLQDEENSIMKGYLDSDGINLALTKITGYLLQVETLINEKAILSEKLAQKQIKWLQSDQIFKERKQTLSDLMRISLSSLNQICEQMSSPESSTIIGEHEKAILMIDDIFIQNRIRSVQFMLEVENLIQIKKETLTDLGQTQIELASKIQFITEERLEMQKNKDEMFYLMEIKQNNITLADILQDQEVRISNLRKVLGYGKR